MRHICIIIIVVCALFTPNIAKAGVFSYKLNRDSIVGNIITDNPNSESCVSVVYRSNACTLNSAGTSLLDTPTMALSSSRKNNWWQQHSDPSTRFRYRQLVGPIALFTLGAFSIGANAPLSRLDLRVRNAALALSGEHKITVDDYLQYLPAAMYLGLSPLPTKSKHTFPEKLCVAAVAFISEAALVNGLKYSIRKPRPNDIEHNSFPSGHTATAFTGAELVRTEYGWSYGIPAYIIATGVGLMRVYNDRHWITDTLGGAAVGIISARIGYWMLPLSRKIFNLKSSSSMAIAPLYYSEQQAAGASCAICF